MRRLAVVLGLSAALLAACTGLDQLNAQKVMAAALLATPDVRFDPTDSGVPDAGFFLPGGTNAYLYFGTRSKDSLDTPPDPVTDALIYLEVTDGGAVTHLPSQRDGTYVASSATDPSLAYRAGATYDFRANEGSGVFIGEVAQVPPAERIADLHPAQGYLLMTAGNSLVLHRPAPPPGVDPPLGLIEVLEMNADGTSSLTYSNAPLKASTLLKIVAVPSTYKQPTITLPASAFPDPAATYFVVFHAVKAGGPATSNLFVGSAVLAGVADVGVVRTQ